MIHGAHVMIYSKDAEADRAFLRDVLKYTSVDAGHGRLIFALPPTEVAVHPSDQNDLHELFPMCDDVQAFIAEMKKQKVECSPVDEQRWGLITRLTLPSRRETRRLSAQARLPAESEANLGPSSQVRPRVDRPVELNKRCNTQ